MHPHAAAAFAFERLPDESASFPELFQPGRQAVLLAVDPDLNGAVAALCWHNPPEGAAEPGATDDASSSSSSVVCSGRTAGSSDSSLASGSSGGGGGSTANGAGRALSAQQQPAGLGVAQAAGTPACAPPPLHSVRLELFDMPVELWRYGSGRDKKHPDAAGLIAILERYSPGSLGAAGGGAAASPVAPAPPKKAGTKGSSKAGKRGRKVGAVGEGAGAGAAEASQQEQDEQQAGQDCAQPVQQQNLEQHHHHQQQQQQQPPVVRALVEYSTPQFISGKLSWYSLGFALGLLNGLLAVAGIPYERVPGEGRAGWAGLLCAAVRSHPCCKHAAGQAPPRLAATSESAGHVPRRSRHHEPAPLRASLRLSAALRRRCPATPALGAYLPCSHYLEARHGLAEDGQGGEHRAGLPPAARGCRPAQVSWAGRCSPRSSAFQQATGESF